MVKDLFIGIKKLLLRTVILNIILVYSEFFRNFRVFSEKKAGLQSDLNKNSHGTSNFKICKDTGSFYISFTQSNVCRRKVKR